ncbi:MAG: hypothetical protein KDN22_12530 [Verrucomicrobiae bacterium]|nr:hypothetical protein [Verrucomicrobiae bacterium]
MKNANLSRCLLAAIVGTSLACVLVGCGSLPTMGRHTVDTVFDLHGLKIRAPEGKEWHHIEDQDGQHFVMLRDELADYVVLYSVTTPSERKLTSLEQLFARLNTDPALEYESLEMGIVEGTPVIRFSRHEEDDGAAYELVRQRMQLKARPDYPKYYTSTRGFMLLHPEDPDCFVTVACARTSYHGFIGSHFEEISEGFFNEFVRENIPSQEVQQDDLGQMAGSPTAVITYGEAPTDLFE